MSVYRQPGKVTKVSLKDRLIKRATEGRKVRKNAAEIAVQRDRDTIAKYEGKITTYLADAAYDGKEDVEISALLKAVGIGSVNPYTMKAWLEEQGLTTWKNNLFLGLYVRIPKWRSVS